MTHKKTDATKNTIGILTKI